MAQIRRLWNVIVGGAVATFRIGTAARGAILPSSFAPFYLAGAGSGEVATCQCRLDSTLIPLTAIITVH